MTEEEKGMAEAVGLDHLNQGLFDRGLTDYFCERHSRKYSSIKKAAFSRFFKLCSRPLFMW